MNSVKIQTKIISPFLAYIISWTIVLTLYNLQWSTLLLPLTINLFLFFFITILFSLLALIFSKPIIFELKITSQTERKIKNAFCLSWLLFLLEAIKAHGFPVLHILKGDYSYGETQFALPIIHILFVFLASLICTAAWLYFNVSRKKIFLFYCILLYIPPILTIARSMFLYNLLSCFIISFSLNKDPWLKKIKKIFFIGFIGLSILFAFGLAGEVRSTENKSEDNIITSLARPSEKFHKLHISEIWLWPYCYITTPLSNLQNTISDENLNPNSEIKDTSLLVYHFLPELIRKRIYGDFKNKMSLVVNYFNVSSIYADAYGRMGYLGMFYSFGGTVLIIVLTYVLRKKKLIGSYLAFVYLSIIVFFNLFNNMFNFMGLAPLFWISLLMSFDWKYVFKLNYCKNKNKAD